MISTITIYWTPKPENFSAETYVSGLTYDRYGFDNRDFTLWENNGLNYMVIQSGGKSNSRAAITLDIRVGSNYEKTSGIALIAIHSFLIMGDI